MWRVDPDREHEALAACGYSFPAEAAADVRIATATYRDLHLYIDFYCYANMEKKKLVNLSGTIPVAYEGLMYNIPVCIWLHETHPQNPPKCLVRPSVSMVINTNSSFVDAAGLVFLRCLRNWVPGRCNLSVVIEEMRAAFQRETPLFTVTPFSPAAASAAPHPECPPQTGSGAAQQFLDPHRQYCPDAGPAYPASASPQRRAVPSPGPAPLSPAKTGPANTDGRQDGQPGTAGPSGTRKSYTEELLDLGITFGEERGHSPSPLNPFLQDTPAANTSPSNLEDVNNLFKSLQLDNVANMYQLNPGNRDAEQVLKQTDRIFTVNKQDFPIQVKKVDRKPMPLPAGIPRDKADMFRSLLSLERRFAPEEVLEAVLSCRDLPSALRFLSHECPICREQVSFGKIITMTHCSCAFCESCFKAYFSSVIKEKSIVAVACPICNKPDVRATARWEEAMDFFSLLDTQIRHYLDEETHELFQRKLRDHALQEMPNFRWCAHCSFGLLHEADRLRMDCPSCGKSTCSKCRGPWVPQHEGLTCEKFKEWQLHNNPEYQTARLEQLLSRNKIDCPKCRFRFYLSKGGCLHFRCTQCQHEFCGGCSRPFQPGPACNFSAECRTRGLHAHHPRDCLYHLRDWSVPRLQQLLQSHRVSYTLQPHGKGQAPRKERTGVCPVLEHRESSSQKEECCGKAAPPEYGGYCMLHYKECLVELINKNRLDPAELYNRAEMEAELQRWKIAVPRACPQEPEEVYLQRLRQVVKQQLRLPGNPGCAGKAAFPASRFTPVQEEPWSTAPNNPGRGVSPNSQILLLLND
ncbi:E3 ubiquitin-protein ligase RNF31 isoform X3 [Scleropages formosus]|uniref:E3 ubiquitin-protein ligase RNF31-like n=1 Tax=Scleropages formosus TaxID=113540 RepID=A0A8C9VNU1_SCLFO|nr:E3 ubiquitin-protein ligase RNF31-like isoform X3 [Scleropages formosus]